LQVGDHLKGCLSCLSWSTDIAYQPTDHYVRALRLRLSDVLSYLGASLLAVWSQDQDVKISFCVEPDRVSETQKKAMRFLRRYGSFNPATRQEAEQVRAMIGHCHAGSPRAQLEPYEPVRYFFQTALQIAPDTEQRLSLLTNLGIVENYQALSERRAQHEKPARQHFARARSYLRQVLEQDIRPHRDTTAQTRGVTGDTPDKTALISACINLAGTEVQQHEYSEPALHRAINLLFEARRRVADFGLKQSDFTAIFSNLLISYLKLYLVHGLKEGLVQADELAREICAEDELARAFLKDCIKEKADPELSQLLERSELKGLATYLNEQARMR
jgi:hypothetical protein